MWRLHLLYPLWLQTALLLQNVLIILLYRPYLAQFMTWMHNSNAHLKKTGQKAINNNCNNNNTEGEINKCNTGQNKINLQFKTHDEAENNKTWLDSEIDQSIRKIKNSRTSVCEIRSSWVRFPEVSRSSSSSSVWSGVSGKTGAGLGWRPAYCFLTLTFVCYDNIIYFK